MMSVNPENWSAVAASINKKYTDALISGDQQQRVESIPTGSPELDVAMGGGVPQGRWTRLYGDYGSTKTMTALCVVAQAQKMGLTCAFYPIEKRYESGLAARLGVDTKKLKLVHGSTIEEVGEKMEALLGVIHLHVLDSTSAAVSEDELTADVRAWLPGIRARAWGKVLSRLNQRFDPVENTAIIINQMRTKGIGTQRGTFETPEGGKVFDHISSMSVLFSAGKWLYYNEDNVLSDKAEKFKGQDDQTVPNGREIKIRIEKSSVCRPFRTATLHFDLDTLQYDRVYEYVKAAKYYGIVRTSGSWYEYVDEDGEITKLQGERKLRQFIADNPALQEYIKTEVLLASTPNDEELDFA
jgi:recombination protein RecA